MSLNSRDRDFRDRSGVVENESEEEDIQWSRSRKKEEVKSIEKESLTDDVIRRAIGVLQKLEANATAFQNPEERKSLQRVKEVHGVNVSIATLQKVLSSSNSNDNHTSNDNHHMNKPKFGKSVLSILSLAGKKVVPSVDKLVSKPTAPVAEEKLMEMDTRASKSVKTKMKFEWEDAADTLAVEQDDQYVLGLKQSIGKEARTEVKKIKAYELQPTWREKRLEHMSDKDWRVLMEDFQISCKGNNVPKPLRYWGESGLPAALLEAIRDAGFTDPSPIQRATLPSGVARRDIIGVAETGSGKTLAFLLPLLSFIAKQPRLTVDSAADGPYAVVMTPSREQAQQIHSEAELFGKYVGTRSACIIGGQNMMEQVVESTVAELLVATPGRQCDLLRQALLVLNQCNYIVLDEADRMLDMGFEPQIQEVMNAMPSTNTLQSNGFFRQTIMFSATMPPKVEALARQYLRDPVYQSIGSRSKLADRVTQNFELVTEQTKHAALLRWLGKFKGPVIIFCNMKSTCDSISKYIQDAKSLRHRSCVIHSGKSQMMREEALESFKSGKHTVLVATDVVGRGIDVRGIQLVINYELPQGPNPVETYTHRVGRTGRGTATGTAVSFVTNEDKDMMPELCKQLQDSRVSVPKFMKQFIKEEEQILW